MLERVFQDLSDDDRQRWAEELAGRGGPELEEALARLGVHITTRGLLIQENMPAPCLIMTGVIGRLAFSDQVQQPEQERFDDAFAVVKDNLVEERYEQIRQRLLGDPDEEAG